MWVFSCVRKSHVKSLDEKYLQILEVRQTVKIRNIVGRNKQRCHYSRPSMIRNEGGWQPCEIKFLELYKWMKYTRINLLDIHNNVIEIQLLRSFCMLITIEEKKKIQRAGSSTSTS